VFLKRKRLFRPQLEVLEDRFAPAVSVPGSFGGMINTGYTPPDPSLAAGPNYVVETVNSSLAIFNKATGAKVTQQTLSTLFSGFATGDIAQFDPSVLYDDQAGRFVVAGQVRDSTNHKAYVDIAVSNSSDPTQGFAEIQQIEVDESGVYWCDNGKLGFNADAYVFSGNSAQFGAAGSFHEIVLTINKSTVLDQSNSTFTCSQQDLWWSTSDYYSLIPARMHGSAAGGPMWFVETAFSGGNTVTVTRMDNVLSPTPTFSDFSVAVNSYVPDPTSPSQPGGSVEADDCRTLNVEWNNNNLVAAFNASVDSDAAAAWVEFNTGASSPALVQQGVIHPGSGISTYMPAVAVDANGDLGLTYMESSASEYVSMYVTGRLVSDSSNTLEAPALVAAGTSPTSSRVGDYSGISLDPSSPTTFWAGNEYGANFWSTWLAKFQFTGGASDQPPTVATPASAGSNPVTGTTTGLSVVGADDSGESSLTYTWSVLSGPAGAPSPTYSANATNAAKNTTATFSQAGTFTFKVTITDPAGLTTTSNVTVTVSQTMSSVCVTPGAATLPDSATQQFTACAMDQFGKALASQPSFGWSLSGIGSLDGVGIFTAPNSGSGSATVTANVATTTSATTSSTAMSASAAVTVVSGPNLTAAASSATQIKLSWSDPVSESGYRVFRSVNGGAWSQIASLSASSSTYTDSTLSAGSTYTYYVQGYNAVGSVNSNQAYVTLAPKAPGGGLSAKAISSSQINLAWSNVSGETGFKIQRSPDNVQWAQVGTTGANVLTFQDTGLTPVTTYYYRVLATNTGGDSPPSSVTRATTQVAPPAAPSNLTAVAVSSTQVNLSWTNNATGQQGFRVQRSNDGGNTWSQIAQVGANTTTYADTRASGGMAYCYRVFAYNGGGNSASSNVAQVTTPRSPTRTPPPPDIPDNGTVVLIGGAVYGPDDAEAIAEAPIGHGKEANAILILFDELYDASVKIANGATADPAVLAALSDANAAIIAAAHAEAPSIGGDAMLTTNSHGEVVWDANPAKAAYVKAASTLGQQMIADANILKAFNI
jgi:fibronectin type 3 domain-containing protein